MAAGERELRAETTAKAKGKGGGHLAREAKAEGGRVRVEGPGLCVRGNVSTTGDFN